MRDYIFEDIEGRYLKADDEMTMLIVNELQKKYNINLNCDLSIDYCFALLSTKLSLDVKELFIKYHCNKAEIIFSILTKLCINSLDFEQEYFSILNMFFKYYTINKVGKRFILDGDKGKLIMHRFTDCIDDEGLIELVNSGACKQLCHTIADVLYERFDNPLIVTSLMPGRFKGQYFHTYFIIDNDFVVDIANNAVFSKKGFYNYFEPEEIISYPSEELESRYNALVEHSNDAKTLSLALEKMKKRY